MKHAPELFYAKNLQNDTRLLFKLKLLLGTVCAYGGEIPLSIKELATRMKTSTQRIRLLLTKLELEGVISRDYNDRIFFHKFVAVKENEIHKKEGLYSKNFAFYTCDEFLSEERNVQRFVLHVVGYELVYLPKHFTWLKLKDLYGADGLLNIRTPKEAEDIVEQAKKYLHLEVKGKGTEKNIHVTGVKEKWLKMGEINSEGANLWTRQRLDQHGFCMEYLSSTAIIQLSKVMEYYYQQFGYDLANAIFDEALRKIQNNRKRSNAFFYLIYREDDDYKEGEADQISAYFRAVMQESELVQAHQLNKEATTLQQNKERLENSGGLLKGHVIQLKQKTELKRIDHIFRAVESKLHTIHRAWEIRWKVDKDWFITNHQKIRKLPENYFGWIQHKIKKQMLFSENE